MPSSGRDSTGFSLQDATALFRLGEFAELIRQARVRKSQETLDPPGRVLVAHAMALVGDLAEAKKLLPANPEELPQGARSQAYVVQALIAHATGALTIAAQHFRVALRLAHESKDVSQIAWAAVYLLNHLASVEPHEAVTAMLPEVRKAVIRAGDPQAIAYLHQAITMLEGQTGGLTEARRHCDWRMRF